MANEVPAAEPTPTAEEAGAATKPSGIIGPQKVTAFEVIKRLEGGNSRPLVVGARDSAGKPFRVVLKFREPDGPATHFGPTSLACELLSSMAARRFALSVPDYFIVTLPKGLDVLTKDAPLKALLSANVGENFGTMHLEGAPTFAPGSAKLKGEALSWFEDVLAFDTLIVNGDRTAGKPNLLWNGSGRPVLIDHSLALGINAWLDSKIPLQVALKMCLVTGQVQSHSAFGVLWKKGREFKRIADLFQNLTKAEVDEMRGHVPSSWERPTGALDKIGALMRARPGVAQAATAMLKGVVQ